jgi:hypothetical protein
VFFKLGLPIAGWTLARRFRTVEIVFQGPDFRRFRNSAVGLSRQTHPIGPKDRAMVRFASLSRPKSGRRTFLKMSVSAAACFSMLGFAAGRRGSGTWVLRHDDA